MNSKQLNKFAHDVEKNVLKTFEQNDIAPPTYECVEYKRMSGLEVLRDGADGFLDIEPEQIDVKAFYDVPFPVLKSYNIANRVKKNYKRDGIEGVQKFLSEIGIDWKP